MTLSLLVLTYGVVLASELGGDRSLVSVGALATRYRAHPVFAGLVLAFAGKALAAVVLGRSITRLPVGLVAMVSTVALLLAAFAIWREPLAARVTPQDRPAERSSALMVAFSNTFFAEWADPGQIATAILASQSGAPLTVWLGATLAMSTKGAIALALARLLTRHVSAPALRAVATATCLVMAVATALHIRL